MPGRQQRVPTPLCRVEGRRVAGRGFGGLSGAFAQGRSPAPVGTFPPPALRTRRADFPFDPDLLRHVSPIEWKNVVLYGEIKIDPAKLKMRRP